MKKNVLMLGRGMYKNLGIKGHDVDSLHLKQPSLKKKG